MKGILKTCTHRKHYYALLCLALFACLFTTAQNPIVTENALPGNPSTEWDIDGAGDLTIQGFATDISVNKGSTIHFKISTDATAYTIDIYRLGYYNGDGARKVGTGVVTATLPQTQPPPFQDTETGLVDCGTWNESAHWDVPSTAVSGIYIAKLTRTDNSGASHMVFIVRDDASTAPLFFQASDATWQAYNVYGGNSLYVGTTSLPAGHASKVSYNRPFITRSGGGGGGVLQDWIFNAEYPMIRFLERNGYDISYTTNIDAVRHGNLLLNHKVFLSVGHDEYWSAEQRTNVEAARNAGVHLAFFSGNEVYWKTRWENSYDGSNTANRTLVCYKEGTVGEVVCGTKCDPSPVWTGLWRQGCQYPSGGGCLPENALSGQISWDGTTGAIKVPAKYKNLRFWRNTSITSLTSESEATFPMGTLGYEWDWEQFPASNPPGRFTLSSTVLNGKTHKLSLYRHSSGALVFGAGTVQWAWGLDSVHDGGNLSPDQRMQQATVNLLADMEVQPTTLQSNLVPATASTDHTAPTSTIVSPTHNVSIVAGTLTTISGTAVDAGGGIVAGIEVSVDGGATWSKANGTTNWSFSWTPNVTGTVVIKVRGVDDSGNLEAAGTAPSSNAIAINIIDAICPCSIFKLTDAPQTTNIFDNITGIEVGVKFKSTANGYITGLRFYKSTNDIGTHIGSLWTIDGTLITQATFSNESASGWQQVSFGAPVAITAGTTYVASYNSPTGYYAETSAYFSSSIESPPLIGLAASEVNDANGVFVYAQTPTFPDQTFNAGNYWVDVIFNNMVGPDVTPPIITSTSPSNFATQIDLNKIITAQFNEFIDVATINSTTFSLKNSANAVIPSTIQASQSSATLTPSSLLTHSMTYTATLKGGALGIKDLAGNALANDYSWSFTVNDPPPLPPTDGPGGPILVVTSSSNPFSAYAVEVLRAEGLNEFASKDISLVNPTLLASYHVVILGEMTVDGAQATMFENWVTAGGTFIAFRPSSALFSLLGLTSTGNTLSDAYIKVDNTASTPGAGIVGQTMQFHGTADLYTMSNGAGATSLLYSNATTATTFPAVTTRSVGMFGGSAVAFTYDLAKSIIYTRQGNPAWAGQKRDGTVGPIRSDDMFFGTNGDPDWIDFNKIAIPQADEQQRLLVNIILLGNLHNNPLPRFWFLPSGHKAAVVMTGDDHDFGGTSGQFNYFKTLGPNTPQDVADWKAIRGTSYIYNGTLTSAEATAFNADGFEISSHINTNCEDVTPSTLASLFTNYLNFFAGNYPDLPKPVTNRIHCIAWSDWASAAKVEVQNGVRLDANYYYWPAAWVQNRPGLFTGSGMPMRFADLDGTMIDCYQLTTQMTDESEINYSAFANALLDKAQGPEGYYGVFCANMHTDSSVHTGANAIIASALAHQVPVISAKQMLTWLDGRNGSSFGGITWNAGQLSFSINALSAANNMQAMVPFDSDSAQLVSITKNGNAVPFTTQTIKGILYAFFAAANGNYIATYGDVATGTITGTVVLQGRPAAPSVEWQVPVQVNIYANGNNTTPAYTYNVTTDQNGTFTIPNVATGTYTITVKSSHTLQRIKTAQNIGGGNNPINFGTLLEGDINGDNFVSALDLGILLSSYNKLLGDSGYIANADLNGDDFVSALDLGILLSNYNTLGEEPE